MHIRHKLHAALLGVFLLPAAVFSPVLLNHASELAHPAIWAGLALCILAMLWISWKITQILLGPLNDLKRGLDRLAQGRLDAILGPGRDAEWREVEASFSRLTRALEATASNRQEMERSLADLEKFNRMALGREMRIIELKREINRLHVELGKKPPYELSFAKDAEPAKTDGF